MGKRGNRSRNRNRGNSPRGNAPRDRGQDLLPKQPGKRKKKKRRGPLDPEKHFLPAPLPERTYDACALSGEEIEDIVTAIAEPRSGKPARFDRVIEKLREQEEVGEEERIAYLGRGAFGIVRIQPGEDGRPELVVRKRIQYEDTHEVYRWRKELAPGISRDYVPQPEPLSDLYSRDELAAFPRFDAAGSAYVSRGN